MKIDIFDTAMAGRYSVIYADPPWSYTQGGHGAATKHYQTMTAAAIKELPVAQLAAKDAVLFMWATFPNPPQALETIEAWGFKYKTLGFNWVKKSRGGGHCSGAWDSGRAAIPKCACWLSKESRNASARRYIA